MYGPSLNTREARAFRGTRTDHACVQEVGFVKFSEETGNSSSVDTSRGTVDIWTQEGNTVDC